MFRVVLPPIIGSAYNCIHSIWYLSHRYCYLTLSWKSWNKFECAVGGVRHPQHTQWWIYTYIGILLGAHYILNIRRIRVNILCFCTYKNTVKAKGIYTASSSAMVTEWRTGKNTEWSYRGLILFIISDFFLEKPQKFSIDIIIFEQRLEQRAFYNTSGFIHRYPLLDLIPNQLDQVWSFMTYFIVFPLLSKSSSLNFNCLD
jgi:hypothetical protein